MPTAESFYMQRALELALLGSGTVSPNPVVGCVIVKNDKVIGEGWHQKYGEAHAEVNAINSVEDKDSLNGADLYVTLEPCAHHGKTPPCAELLVRYQFRKVFICNDDPFPLVSGKGIEIIRKANIPVEVGMMASEGRFVNRRFFTFVEKKRPYIILKWAQTSDGFIARQDFTSKWISNELSRKVVHKWRAEEDAVIVGRNTVTCDNPSLTVRDWSGRNPVRVVVDPQLSLQKDINLFDESATTLIYNEVLAKEEGRNIFVKVDSRVELIPFIVNDLYTRKIQSIIVEGGSRLLNSFVEIGLWDEARTFISKELFVSGIQAPKLRVQPDSVTKIANDTLEICYHFKAL